ncbi:MAG: restriction endonuclease [Bacteroidetes bacterium]|nr:restriction endonuclease [Bacteroidota bacterium]
MSKIEEALDIIKQLGLPKAQHNSRTALCLLALLDLTEDKKWSQSQNPLIGTTPIMDFARDHYNVVYKPNTRESIRRQSLHQMVDAGIALINPDDKKRSINSPKTVYQIEPTLLEVLKKYGTPNWKKAHEKYIVENKSLAQRYAKEREMEMLPVKLPSGKEILISPGEHSTLIKNIVEQFAPRFAPGSELVYVGDTGEKMGYFDEKLLTSLGVQVDHHGKMPDVVLYFKAKNWLLLVESVTSHGPVDAKRHQELSQLFKSSQAPLVYVTAFPSRSTMAKYLSVISWETEVWCSDAPSHLIHFNGERFLGPY